MHSRFPSVAGPPGSAASPNTSVAVVVSAPISPAASSPDTPAPPLAPYRRIRLAVPHRALRSGRLPSAFHVAPDAWKALALAFITVVGLAIGHALVSALGARDGYCTADPTTNTLAAYACGPFFRTVRVLWFCCPFVVGILALAAVADPGLVAATAANALPDAPHTSIELRDLAGAAAQPADVGSTQNDTHSVALSSADSSSDDSSDDADSGSGQAAKRRHVHPQSPYVPVGTAATRGTFRLVHCRYCGADVRHFDHHCVIFGICVARANMGVFVLATTLYSVWLCGALYACVLGLCALYGSHTPMDLNGSLLSTVWVLGVGAATSAFSAVTSVLSSFAFPAISDGMFHVAALVFTAFFDLRAAFLALATFVFYLCLFCTGKTVQFWAAVLAGTDTVEGRRRRSRARTEGRHSQNGCRWGRIGATVARRLRALCKSLLQTKLAEM